MIALLRAEGLELAYGEVSACRGLSFHVAEGEIVSWLVNPGDAVAENQEMVEVMTDVPAGVVGFRFTGKLDRDEYKAVIIPPVRDYYRVEDDDGGRFWLFRDGPLNAAKWFLHGFCA